MGTLKIDRWSVSSVWKPNASHPNSSKTRCFHLCKLAEETLAPVGNLTTPLSKENGNPYFPVEVPLICSHETSCLFSSIKTTWSSYCSTALRERLCLHSFRWHSSECVCMTGYWNCYFSWLWLMGLGRTQTQTTLFHYSYRQRADFAAFIKKIRLFCTRTGFTKDAERSELYARS